MCCIVIYFEVETIVLLLSSQAKEISPRQLRQSLANQCHCLHHLKHWKLK